MSLRPYDVFVHEKLLACAPRSGRSRQRILDFARSLSSDPFQRGDYEDSDPAGHPTPVKLVGRYAVTFFVDHAAREVKIVNIQPADQA
jgi:hypothetical protein